MPARKPPIPNEKPQFERFIETARAIGAGETDEELERVVRKMTTGRPLTKTARPLEKVAPRLAQKTTPPASVREPKRDQ